MIECMRMMRRSGGDFFHSSFLLIQVDSCSIHTPLLNFNFSLRRLQFITTHIMTDIILKHTDIIVDILEHMVDV